MVTLGKLDFKKEFKELYSTSKKDVAVVEVPEINYLMVDGKGDPNTEKSFQEAIEALYGLSFTLKFKAKKGPLATDYVVMPLQGLWWAEDMDVFTLDKKGEWLWTLMIMQPDFITSELMLEAKEELKKKKDPAALDKVRLETYHEGLSAQILHIGPYSEEGPTIKKLHDFTQDNGYTLHGKHHEIYMSDARRTAPEKLKTILRQPMRKA